MYPKYDNKIKVEVVQEQKLHYLATMLPCESQPHENVSHHKVGELLKVLITK